MIKNIKNHKKFENKILKKETESKSSKEKTKNKNLKKDKKTKNKHLKEKIKNKNLKKNKKIKDKHLREHKKEETLTFLKTYIDGFDELMRQGIPEGSSVLVEGGPGSGKTVFCLTLLKNFCEKGKKVLYMSFEEPEERLKIHLKNFGADPEDYEKKKLLYIKRFNALDIARSVEALLSEAKKELLVDVQPVLIPKDFQPEIVLIDSLTSIGSAFSGEESRFRVYMEQLFRYLEGHKITSFLIRETSVPSHTGSVFVEKGEAVSFLSDGIIAIYNVFLKESERKRAMEIVKIRGTEFDRKIIEMDIKPKKGVVVYPEKILKGEYVLT